MADKFSTMPPRIVQLLLMAFSHSATDGERSNAMRAFDRYLASVGSDGHDVVEKIKTTPPDEAAMREQLKAEARKIFDAGYAKRVADETEQRQRSAGAIASLTTAGEGHNGYSWREIVGHCVLNQHRIHNGWEANTFIPSIAAQLTDPSYEVSAKQAPIVRRIFQQWFHGEI
jgi:hypothetical protein